MQLPGLPAWTIAFWKHQNRRTILMTRTKSRQHIEKAAVALVAAKFWPLNPSVSLLLLDCRQTMTSPTDFVVRCRNTGKHRSAESCKLPCFSGRYLLRTCESSLRLLGQHFIDCCLRQTGHFHQLSHQGWDTSQYYDIFPCHFGTSDESRAPGRHKMNPSVPSLITGGCLCGGVRYEVKFAPDHDFETKVRLLSPNREQS